MSGAWKGRGAGSRTARAALVVAGLLLGLGVIGGLEAFVRLRLDVYRCDSRLGWTFEPGGTGIKWNREGEFATRARFNAHGLRDDERSFEKADGEYRVLLLGDSIAASLQVDQPRTFYSIAERRLREGARADRSIELINAGIDGFGTGQELLLLQELGLRFDPDLVLLQMFISNDLVDNYAGAGDSNHYLATRCGRPYFARRDGGLELRRRPQPARSPRTLDRWLRHSQLYASLVPMPVDDTGGAPALRIADVFSDDPPPALAEAWALTKALIRSVRDEARRRDIALVVLVAPSKQAVGQPEPGVRPVDQPEGGYAMLSRFLQEEGIPHIDPLPALQAQFQAGTPPYFEVDSHWNEEGHATVGAVMYDWLAGHCAELGLPLRECSS